MRKWTSGLLIAPLSFAACGAMCAGAVRIHQPYDMPPPDLQCNDPIAGKVGTYLRLLRQGGGNTTEIADFLTDNPDWPNAAQLESRREEALTTELDQRSAIAQCDRAPSQLTGALLRCAEAYSADGRPADSARFVRRAWTTAAGIVDPISEAAFLRRWGAVVTAADQWARFNAVMWAQPDAATRQSERLQGAWQVAAHARLALRRNDARAEVMLARVSPDLRAEPGLMLEHATWLRHRERLDEARDLWRAEGREAQSTAAPERLPAFWAERNQLVRLLLLAGEDAAAYELTDAPGNLPPRQLLDAEFLAGFIALRRLHDPNAAIVHWRALASLSHAALTQSRAHFWLARAELALGHSGQAELQEAASWPLTFYGQMAAMTLDPDPAALGLRIRSIRDPVWTQEQAIDFAATELVRAAGLLVSTGQGWRAGAFLLRADEAATLPAERALAAHLASNLRLPDVAVAIARRFGRDGLQLPEAGWPAPVELPASTLDPAIVLALIRQESSFDAQAVSPSGARGLMQLMPATAQAVSRKTGEPAAVDMLTKDPQFNMRLGTEYLTALLAQFDGNLPLAFAAYNAGPTRVQTWLSEYGDPRRRSIDILDWIELIPFGETRNYVERVLENVVVYQARGGRRPTVQANGER